MMTRDKNKYTSAGTLTPFVHRVATEGGKYVFDVNTGEIFRVDEVVWEIVEDSHLSETEVIARHAPRFTPVQIAEAYHEISRARAESGYFLSEHPSVGVGTGREQIHRALAHRRRQLILEVTEKCNFACTYCQRNLPIAGVAYHGTRDMDWETARAAIDDFLRHCCNSEARNVGEEPSPAAVPSPAEMPKVTDDSIYLSFYGGEPLLNFPLIKKCTEYVLEKAKRRVYFVLTTNGYLLEGDKAEFVGAHDFLISVSFDGPASFHDRHRRTKEGLPTHGVVWDHLRAFIRRYPRQVGINAVVARGMDARAVHRYFASADWIPPTAHIRMAPASPPYPEYYPSSPGTEESPGWREMRKEFTERFIKGRILPGGENREISLVREALFNDLTDLHRYRWRIARRRQKPEPYTPPGPCLAGATRTFVSVAGEYYPCERVLPREMYQIGSVATGIDEERVYNLLREFIECTRPECERCWCLPFCPIGCYATVCDHTGFSVAAKRRACEEARDSFHRSLEDYCTVLERNPRAFDLIEAQAVSA